MSRVLVKHVVQGYCWSLVWKSSENKSYNAYVYSFSEI